jgi:hypothetical protein
VLGSVNGSSAIGVAGNNGGSGPGVQGTSSGGIGVQGTGGSYGVFGDSSSVGVYGRSDIGGGIGVYGSNPVSSTSTPAVYGLNNGSGPGVLGSSNGGIGVSGSTTTPAGGPPAVQGVNGGSGPGVVGFTPTGTGVGGGTDSGIGFGGIATGTGSGVQGQAASGSAVLGVSTGSGHSGFFTGGGGVLINGSLTQMNGSKSAAVRGADGKLQRLYCVESPESWFEDFGSGQLSNGTATVQIEPGFAGVSKTDAYRVFLTAEGETNGLHVTNKTPSSFVVREGHGGTSNVSFSYRVVAKRKDIEGTRLEHVDEPPVVQLLKLPELPVTPPPVPAVPTPPRQSGE